MKALLAAVLLAVSQAAPAATAALDEDALVGLAERVVVGVVTAVEVRPWGPAEVPVTVVTVAVAETWKGPEAPTLTVVQPGGALGGRIVQVEGSIPWTVGLRVVVFAERSSTGALVPAGQDVGALEIGGPLRAVGQAAVTGGPFRGWDLAAARAWVTTR